MRGYAAAMSAPWIEADVVGIAAEALPEWARAAVPAERGVVLARDGIVLRDRRGRVSAATWGRVFGVVQHAMEPLREQRVLVLVPREPPAPPWLELSVYDLPSAIDGLPALADAIRQRLAQGGSYRGREPGAPRLTAAELLERARTRAAIPGAVQVPVASQRHGVLDTRLGQVAVFGGSAGAMSAYFAAAAGAAGPLMLGIGVAGAAAAGLLTELGGWYARRERARTPLRVLLLAPDGCVCGFAEGVAALSWPEVAEFREEPGTSGAPALAVRDHDGRLRGTIDAFWFGEPLDLIVAVAEAYRKRAAAGA